MDSNMRKVVAPQKQPNGKTYWNNIGVMGVKGDKVWIKLNMIPMGWDGYCMGVEMKDRKNTEDAPAAQPDPEAGGGGYEGETPGF